MKSVYFHQHGEREQLTYGELPAPRLEAGTALVRVKYCALNHLDIWIRRGWPGLKLSLPHIGGSDVVGELVAAQDRNGQELSSISSALGDAPLGSDVMVNPGIEGPSDRWVQAGDASASPGYGIVGETRPGGLAELIVVPLENVFPTLPDRTLPETCAALLTGTTCWRMLFHRGQLTPAETVLTVGTGGGVNSLAIQIASRIGARVIALAGGAEKANLAKELGAAESINYHEVPSWPKAIYEMTNGIGVDMVIDNVGQASMNNSLKAVRRGGRIVTVGNTTGYELRIDNRYIFGKQISLIGSTMGTQSDFIDAQKYLYRNKIVPLIDEVAPLEETARLVEKMEEGKHAGKLIAHVQESPRT